MSREQPLIRITNLIWSFDPIQQTVNLLLIKRSQEPYQHYWALPETLMRPDESADQAALRLVQEKIGLTLGRFHTEQLATFTNPLRSPGEGRSISLAYMTFLPQMVDLVPGYGAQAVAWFKLASDPHDYRFTYKEWCFTTTAADNEYEYYQTLPHHPHFENTYLAFDHDWLIKTACLRIKNKLRYQPLILLILGDTFTLKAARSVYAPFWHTTVKAIDNSNFRKTHHHLFVKTNQTSTSRPGRPAQLYRLAPPILKD